MKIKPDYILREVVDYYVVIGTGADAYRPNEILSLNETGAFLWKILEGGAAKQDLIDHLVLEYEVDEETAAKDVEAFLDQLRRNSMIIE